MSIVIRSFAVMLMVAQAEVVVLALDDLPTIGLHMVADQMTAPVHMATANDGSGRLFVADQVGYVWIIDRHGQRQEKPLLDLRSQVVRLRGRYDERGLLGIACHPKFAENGRFFVYYSAKQDPEDPREYDSETRLSEFHVQGDDRNVMDPRSERVLLDINQPQANHNGGHIVFGPDGFLYVSVGDGGKANDEGVGHHPQLGNGQDRMSLLGKILRIDVDRGEPYTVPADNPFVGQPHTRPEIYALGFRNVWGMSFGPDHRLFAADVGQNLFEEVNIVVRGGNYGWRIKEATHCFSPSDPNNPPRECSGHDRHNNPLIDPVIEYRHSDEGGRIVGSSVTGGFVYRGSAIPALRGRYVFGDWSTGFLLADGALLCATETAAGQWRLQALEVREKETSLGMYVLAFGQDREGELYVLTSESLGPVGKTGKVFKLVP